MLLLIEIEQRLWTEREKEVTDNMSKEQSAGGSIQWTKVLKKLSPYTIQKGFRYLKHYGPKEFWIRLHERFEPEDVPYGPWYEVYIPDEETLEKQR